MNQIIAHILEIFQLFRMAPLTIDEYEQKGKALLAAKIETFVKLNVPIPFTMLGYPFKSTNNRDKVIGTLPDLGEEESLRNFGIFNDMVKAIYSPGIHIHIVNDGFAFNDLLGVFDHAVKEYEEITLDMAKGMPITIYDLTHFYNDHRIFTMREKLMLQWAPTDAQLQNDILNDLDTQMLYRGMSIFMEQELANRPYDSRNQRHKAAKILTREMMRRNQAYSALMNSHFSDMIRISMHPSVNNGKKYSWNLYPTDAQLVHHSPWHSALLRRADGKLETIHRKDAEMAGYDLIWKDQRPYYFLQS